MDVKEALLDRMVEARGDFTSGESLSEELGISRNAVSKAASQLREAGFTIESRRKMGYRLTEHNLRCPTKCIRQYLKSDGFSFVTADSVVSTNTALRELASDGACEWTVFLAGEQTGGRGRWGKTFFSPRGTGVYMSILLYPSLTASDARLITTCAAVAVCRAIEKVCDKKPLIKWVNDIYIGNKKVCGILTEGAFNAETGSLSHAILGIGINLFPPREGFGTLTGIAGTVLKDEKNAWDVKGQLVAAICDNFRPLYEKLPDTGFFEEYRERSYLSGKKIEVIRNGEGRSAVALEIGGDLRLHVRYGDGSEEWLDSGEVSVKPEL